MIVLLRESVESSASNEVIPRPWLECGGAEGSGCPVELNIRQNAEQTQTDPRPEKCCLSPQPAPEHSPSPAQRETSPAAALTAFTSSFNRCKHGFEKQNHSFILKYNY